MKLKWLTSQKFKKCEIGVEIDVAFDFLLNDGIDVLVEEW